MSDLKSRIGDATRDAMKARDKARVGALRLVGAEIKRVEVDERRDLEDSDVLAILNRMIKQRRDSLQAYEQAGREDLAAQERFEIDVVSGFLPEPLADAEIDALIEASIAETGAASMRDMGAVMAKVKAAAEGRVDMGAVSDRVKGRLGAA